MDNNQVKALEQDMDDTWEVPEARKTVLPSFDNIKKEYTYGSYKNIVVYALKETTKEGYNFIVLYSPTGVCFGFEGWGDAEAFAKGRNAHASAFNKLMGEN
ncbi:hypothetical protein KAU43_07525 [candidate division WOR-3 bacterium]|nr:hypothetical protein [candidate division WOR-3 bacterium]